MRELMRDVVQSTSQTFLGNSSAKQIKCQTLTLLVRQQLFFLYNYLNMATEWDAGMFGTENYQTISPFFLLFSLFPFRPIESNHSYLTHFNHNLEFQHKNFSKSISLFLSLPFCNPVVFAALMKHGIIPKMEMERAPTDLEYDEMAANNRDRLADEERHRKAERVLAEENEEDADDDDAFMQQYRQKRMQQIQADVVRNRYGTLTEIGQTEYKSEVTQAPEDTFVVVFLYKQGYVFLS